MTPHLTHEQLCDLLLDSTPQEVHEAGRLELLREHLRDCSICATDLASLKESLTVFRSTATAWSTREWTRAEAGVHSQRLVPTHPRFFAPAALWTAAAALVVGVMITFSMHESKPVPPAAHTKASAASQPATGTTPAQAIISDEALLEEVDATLSSSVPSPMQPLDDPTAGLHSLNKQRKN